MAATDRRHTPARFDDEQRLVLDRWISWAVERTNALQVRRAVQRPWADIQRSLGLKTVDFRLAKEWFELASTRALTSREPMSFDRALRAHAADFRASVVRFADLSARLDDQGRRFYREPQIRDLLRLTGEEFEQVKTWCTDIAAVTGSTSHFS